jgi:hypothetical protein
MRPSCTKENSRCRLRARYRRVIGRVCAGAVLHTIGKCFKKIENNLRAMIFEVRRVGTCQCATVCRFR